MSELGSRVISRKVGPSTSIHLDYRVFPLSYIFNLYRFYEIEKQKKNSFPMRVQEASHMYENIKKINETEQKRTWKLACQTSRILSRMEYQCFIVYKYNTRMKSVKGKAVPFCPQPDSWMQLCPICFCNIV